MSRTSNNYGAPQGGGGASGASYDVSVFATGQSTTDGNYGNLSYSNVSTVQHGTFENGTVNTTSDYSTTATGVTRFTFDTAGVYVVEFVTYAQSASNGFQFVDLFRNGSTSRDEVLCYLGVYSNFNRKTGTAVRKFEVGDELTFFTRGSSNSNEVSRLLIAKIG